MLEEAGVKVLSFGELLEQGGASPAEPQAPTLDDTSTIMYTSGTTGPALGRAERRRGGGRSGQASHTGFVCPVRCAGNPKGVVLTHRAVLATIAGLQGFLDNVRLLEGAVVAWRLAGQRGRSVPRWLSVRHVARAVRAQVKEEFGPSDVYLSFLTCAHIFGR